MSISEQLPGPVGDWFPPPDPIPEPVAVAVLLPPTGTTDAAREAEAAASCAASIFDAEAACTTPSLLGALVARQRITEAAVWSCDRDRIVAAVEAEAEALTLVVDAVTTTTYQPPPPAEGRTRRFATTQPERRDR